MFQRLSAALVIDWKQQHTSPFGRGCPIGHPVSVHRPLGRGATSPLCLPRPTVITAGIDPACHHLVHRLLVDSVLITSVLVASILIKRVRLVYDQKSRCGSRSALAGAARMFRARRYPPRG